VGFVGGFLLDRFLCVVDMVVYYDIAGLLIENGVSVFVENPVNDIVEALG
jgi:hypothetical protein